MEWLERYLQAIRKHLPWERQEDIIAELRTNLQAQLEEREEQMGRSMTEGEMIDWIRQLGPPAVMASRYQPTRYLIGPNLFPMYRSILRLVLIWASVGYTVAIVAQAIFQAHNSSWLAGQCANYLNIWITSAAWVTGGFAATEYFAAHHPEKCPPMFSTGANWSPTGLAPLEKPRPARGKPVSFANAVAEFVVQCALLTWLLLIPHQPWMLIGPAAAYLHRSPVLLTPILLLFYWAIVALTAMQAAWQGYNLLTDEWRFKSTAQHLFTKALGIVPIAILVIAPGQKYLIANPVGGALPDGLQIDALNHYIWVGCVVVGIITVIQFAWDAWKALAGRSGWGAIPVL